MNIKDVKVGTKLEINIDNNEDNIKQAYISQLEGVIDENNIVISTPIYEGLIIPISMSTRINIIFYTDKGIFSFYGIVNARRWKENLSLLKIKIDSPIIKSQRREYFRFNYVMPIQLRQVSEDENNEFIKVITKGISGGGIRLISKKELALNEIVEMQLLLKGRRLNIKGQVVRCIPYEEDFIRYDIGIEYKEISEFNRETIIKFIFYKQVELVRKGIL